MKRIIYILLTFSVFFVSILVLFQKESKIKNKTVGVKSEIYNFSAKDTSGKLIDFSEYEGKVLLIVNTASQCGLTPQYEGLEKLYKKYKDKGFEVLAFPCNQFGSQEPGSNEEIKKFCNLRFNTSFRIFSKINVNGKNAHPLFSYLKKEAKGIMGSESIKWNFTKFLVGRKGKNIKRFAPSFKPLSLEPHIESSLKKNS